MQKSVSKIAFYSYQTFLIQVQELEPQKINIIIMDLQNILKYEKLNHSLFSISAKTISLAFQQKQNNNSKILPCFTKKIIQGTQCLTLQISVQSPFIQCIVEEIVFQKQLQMTQKEYYQHKIQKIKSKLKQLNQQPQVNKNIVYLSVKSEQREISKSQHYQQIGSICNLEYGKYLFAASFLAKIKTEWGIYIYVNQGQHITQKDGMYTPNQQQFIPISFRKIYTINAKHPKFSLTTWSSKSYPLVVKNVLITAKLLDQDSLNQYFKNVNNFSVNASQDFQEFQMRLDNIFD